MGEDDKSRRRRVVEDIESLVEDVSKVVTVAVTRGSEAAGTVGERLRETLKETIHGARDSVVMVRVDKESLTRLDDLVEAGISGSRSEAGAFLIGEGVKARQGLFDRIAEKIEQIRAAKDELRQLLEDEEPPDEPSSPVEDRTAGPV